MKIWIPGLLATVLLLAGAQAGAAGWVSILKNTPAEAFDDQDLRLFLDAAGSALNAQGPPQPVTWSNPATGAGGRFLVLDRSVDKDGAQCKRVRFSVHASKRAEKSTVWTACKGAEGGWRLRTAG